jgi:hypothetical protein
MERSVRLIAGEADRGDTPSWGCAPPLNHVPEGMRLFLLVSLELPMCILVCQPRGCPHSLVCLPLRPAQLVEKVANRDVWDFGWGGCPPGRFTRHPPISLDTMVPRTGGYAYDVGVWDLSIVQGPFSVAPCQTFELRFATFSPLYRPRPQRERERCRDGETESSGAPEEPPLTSPQQHASSPRHGGCHLHRCWMDIDASIGMVLT